MVYYQVPEKRLARSQAVQQLRKCVAAGKIIPGKHFRDELAKEGLIFGDALRVLKTGQIYSEPDPDPKSGDWKYRVEGSEVDGNGSPSCFVSRQPILYF